MKNAGNLLESAALAVAAALFKHREGELRGRAGQSAWVPGSNPRDASTFQGSTTVPDLCRGGAMEIGDRATFTAMVGSQ